MRLFRDATVMNYTEVLLAKKMLIITGNFIRNPEKLLPAKNENSSLIVAELSIWTSNGSHGVGWNGNQHQTTSQIHFPKFSEETILEVHFPALERSSYDIVKITCWKLPRRIDEIASKPQLSRKLLEIVKSHLGKWLLEIFQSSHKQTPISEMFNAVCPLTQILCS